MVEELILMLFSVNREKVLLLVLGIFLLSVVGAHCNTGYNGIIYCGFALYYGTLGILLSLGWDWLCKSIDLDNTDTQHKAEEGE